MGDLQGISGRPLPYPDKGPALGAYLTEEERAEAREFGALYEAETYEWELACIERWVPAQPAAGPWKPMTPDEETEFLRILAELEAKRPRKVKRLPRRRS